MWGEPCVSGEACCRGFPGRVLERVSVGVSEGVSKRFLRGFPLAVGASITGFPQTCHPDQSTPSELVVVSACRGWRNKGKQRIVACGAGIKCLLK